MGIPRLDALDRNLIINGNMDYFQRGVGPIALNGVYSSVDRFLMGGTATAKTGERSTSVPPNGKSRYSLLNKVTPTLSTQNTKVAQRIESIFTTESVGKPLSVGFWYKTNAATSVIVRFISPDTTADDYGTFNEYYAVKHTIIDDNTWRYLPLDNVVTVPADGARGIAFRLQYEDWSTTGSEVEVSTTQIKVSLTKKAQEFSYMGRDVIEELSLCQRYLKKVMI